MTTWNGSTLSDLFGAITPYSSEADVESKVIIPLLRILGYSDQDWQEQFIIGKVKLDFLVHPKEAALPYPRYLVIEAKAASKKISGSGWQISGYMRKAGAVMGLLTNGYQFRLLYHYEGKIEPVVEYSQAQLIEEFNRFYKLLCKETCLKVIDALYKKHQQFQIQFGTVISKAFANQAMLGLFKKKNPPSPGEDINQVEASLVEPESTTPVQKSKEGKSMIITVFNNKGGVGKTTMTINLAAALNQLGKRVLLIDIDAQANLTTGLGIDPLDDIELQGKKDITHLLTEPKTKLEDTIVRKRWKAIDIELDIVPSHIRLSQMENQLMQTVDSDRLLTKKLKNHGYDFVFIDPPPSFGKVNRISLMASSGILVPTQLSPYPVRALEYVLEQAYQLKEYREDNLPILGIAVSMYDERSSTFNLSMVERIYEIFQKNPEGEEIKLFPEKTWIPRLNVVSKCPDWGYPLYQVEFEPQLSQHDKQTAQNAIERYQELAKHLIATIDDRGES